jgi:RNA polymerase sigma-70 factor (ECF subfamily)
VGNLAIAALGGCFEEAREVRVVVDGRTRERRTLVRRTHERPLGTGAERRLVRNLNGRRVDDRRRAVVFQRPRALPLAADSLRDRIEFVAPRPGEDNRLAIAESLRLVVRFQMGESDAFGSIYERHFDGVYGYLLTALRDRHDAEDGAQEVFIRALRGLPNYEFRSRPFEAWLFRIARNHTLNVKQRAAPVSPADPASLELWRDARWAADALPAGTDRDLLLFIERLPPSQRQVIVLRYMVGLDWGDIATVLERSNGAVRQLEQRAFTYLRSRLQAVERRAAARTQSLPMSRLNGPSPVASGRLAALAHGTRAA